MKSPLKYHGGKSYLAGRIVALMPRHTCYVEPFAGGLSVLLAKDPNGTSEIVNDLDGNLTTFWRVLKDPGLFQQFQRRVEATPFAEAFWREAGEALEGNNSSALSRAVAFFVRCRQSLAGRMDSFAPMSATRTRRGMNEQASAWLTAVEGLPVVHARLKRVAILNRPALDVIRQHDQPETLFYLDPPYLAETRSAPNVYGHEMTENDHRELLDVILRVRGKVVLSGYRSELYDKALEDWHRIEWEASLASAGGRTKRTKTEVLWCNFLPQNGKGVQP